MRSTCHSLLAVAGITLALLAALEAGSALLVRHISTVAGRFDRQRLARAYPNMRYEDARDMLQENWRYDQFRYEPFVEMGLKSFHGTYVNVFDPGYRAERELPWPPPTGAVFLFGGSTTFGVGVSDAQTIAAYLQRMLPGNLVYNFATPTYHSTMERIRFLNLAVQGIKPRHAVFIDGLNDIIFYKVPDRSKFSNRLAMASDISLGTVLRSALNHLNTVKALLYYTGRSDFASAYGQPSPEDITRATLRMMENRRILAAYAAQNGVDAIFITQPVPTVRPAGQTAAETTAEDLMGAEHCIQAYRLLHELYLESPLAGHRFLDDLQTEEPMYVDNFHYSSRMNERIAQELAAIITRDRAGASDRTP